MMSTILTLTTSFFLLAALSGHALAGFRHGDRAGDAQVRAGLRSAGQPGEDRPVIVASVRNPSSSPVIVGLAVRRGRRGRLPTGPTWLTGLTGLTGLAGPAWLTGLAGLAGPMDSVVPRRTARRKFRPDGYPTVGVVAAGSSAEFAVPVTAGARRYRLTVVIGQADDRLRVWRLRVDDAQLAVGRPLSSAHEIPGPGTDLRPQG